MSGLLQCIPLKAAIKNSFYNIFCFQNDRNGLGAAIALVSGAALAVKLYSEQDNR